MKSYYWSIILCILCLIRTTVLVLGHISTGEKIHLREVPPLLNNQFQQIQKALVENLTKDKESKLSTKLSEIIKDENVPMQGRVRAVQIVGKYKLVECFDVLVRHLTKIRDETILDDHGTHLSFPCIKAIGEMGEQLHPMIIKELDKKNNASYTFYLCMALSYSELSLGIGYLDNKMKTSTKSRFFKWVKKDLVDWYEKKQTYENLSPEGKIRYQIKVFASRGDGWDFPPHFSKAWLPHILNILRKSVDYRELYVSIDLLVHLLHEDPKLLSEFDYNSIMSTIRSIPRREGVEAKKRLSYHILIALKGLSGAESLARKTNREAKRDYEISKAYLDSVGKSNDVVIIENVAPKKDIAKPEILTGEASNLRRSLVMIITVFGLIFVGMLIYILKLKRQKLATLTSRCE